MPEYTEQNQWNVLASSNDTSASITVAKETTTLPTTNKITLPNTGNRVPNIVQLKFFGAGSDGNAFTYTVYGWAKSGSGVYEPTALFGGTATMGTTTGASGGTLGTSGRYCDTLDVATFGNDGVNVDVISPANNETASLKFDACGFDFVTVSFAKGTATSCNALYRFVA